MKKIIFSLAAWIVAIASATSAIGCVQAAYSQGEIGERLVMAIASGQIFDKSFNQEAYEGILNYSNRSPSLTGKVLQGGFDFQNRGLSARHNYVQALKPDTSELISSYKMAVVKGVDILSLVGFQHSPTIDVAADLVGEEKTVIFIDSSLGSRPNIINVIFNSQLAGFAAGYDAAVWATTKGGDGKMLGDVHNNGIISFGTYAGISSKYAVDNYMWGFMVAIRYFNMRMANDSDLEQQKRHIYFANVGFKGEVEKATNITGTNTNYFTGSFEASGANKVGMNQVLYDKGKASVIFPIAGPQIADTLSYAPHVYVIGVDTDQSKQYSHYENRFITSALKNLQKALSDAINHAKANRLNHHPDGTLKSKPLTGDEYWDGTKAPAQSDWSIDVDQKLNSKGSKIPYTLLDYQDPKFYNFIRDVTDYYDNRAGKYVESYMSPEKIGEMAQIIYDKYRDLIPTEFEFEKSFFA